MRTKSFVTLAAWSAFVAGTAGFLYAVCFVVLTNPVLYSLFLMLGGLASLAVWTGLYERFREIASPYPLLAFLLSVGAAAGSLLHGGYDLANALHPPATLNADLPSPIDPRGLHLWCGFPRLVFLRMARHQGPRLPYGPRVRRLRLCHPDGAPLPRAAHHPRREQSCHSAARRRRGLSAESDLADLGRRRLLARELLICEKQKSHIHVIASAFCEATSLLAGALRPNSAGACFVGENTLLAMTFGSGHSFFKSH